ncbi:MAG: RNA polymerase sigma factor [Planctomycetota bacterium]
MKKYKLNFHDVYNQFHAKIQQYLERLIGKSEAEDLTQEVFVKIDKGLNKFKGESKLSTWIYQIATNTALDKLRSSSFRRNNQEISLSVLSDQPKAEDRDIRTPEKTLSAEREAIRKEMNECIRSLIDKLPEDYRTVIILSELKELTNRDIAEILGISLDTVKIRLHRARAKLKAEFEASCTIYHDDNNVLACDRKQQKSEKEADRCILSY